MTAKCKAAALQRGRNAPQRTTPAATSNCQLPDIGRIKVFVDKLKDKGFTQHANLRRWLVVARALAWLEERSPVPLRDVMRRHFLLGRQVRDIEDFLRDIARREGQKRLERLRSN